MPKVQWFKVAQDVRAQYEDPLGGVHDVIISKGAKIQTGIHPKQVLLPNGDVMWGLTLIPATVLKKVRG